VSASSIEEALRTAIEQSSPAIKIILPKRLRDAEPDKRRPRR
jgi:hypothetical protein